MRHDRSSGLSRAALLLGIGIAVVFAVPPFAHAGTALLARRGGTNDVVVVDTAANRTVGNPIKVGTGPSAIAITPDGSRAYVVNSESKSVSVMDMATDQVVQVKDGAAIKVGVVPSAIAIAPDGRTAYVTNAVDRNVSVIDTTTNEVKGQPIPVGILPRGIAITPDGKRAYVVNTGLAPDAGTVQVIDTATNRVVGQPIPVGLLPRSIAITPDGSRAYVLSSGGVGQNLAGLSAIDTATNEVASTISVGRDAESIAISPDGRTAWVAARLGEKVEPIDIATNEREETVLVEAPGAIAIDPAGRNLYAVEESLTGGVAVINPRTSQLRTVPDGRAISVGAAADAIAIAPDRSPHADLKIPGGRVRPGMAVTLDASSSTDPDGAIASYAWSFGDGSTATGTAAKVSHTYAAPGVYRVELTIADNEGCGPVEIFTGQTASCQGGGAPRASGTITVANPGLGSGRGPRVRVRCPKKAGRRCTIRVQAIVKKPLKHRKRVRAESRVAVAKAKAGRTAIVSLKPLPAFADALARASAIRVKERIVGQKKFRRTRYPLLPVLR
jgi:YVTN family beta-propeller protein